MKKLFSFLAGCLIGFSVHAGGIDNPSSGLLPGVAIGQAATFEIATTNGMVSEDFTAGTTWFDWVPSGGITAAFNTSFLAPNGTSTATTLTTAAGGTTSVWGAQTVGAAFAVGTKGVCSIFVRAGTSTRMRFECGDTGGGGGFPYPNFVEFNPATGQTFSANGLTLINSINVNGVYWWRLGVAWTSAGGNPQLMITPASASLTATGTLHVWGAMIEQSTNTENVPSNYLPNTSTASANLRVPGKIHTSFLDHSTEEVFTSVTGNYTLLGTDSGKLIIGNSAATTVTVNNTVQNGFWFDVLNRRTGAGTLTLSGATFNGAGLPTAGTATVVFPSTSSNSGLINCGRIRVTTLGGYDVDCVAYARGYQTITTSTTWIAPRNVTQIYVSAVAGGGGGGGSTGAGGVGGNTCISTTAGTCAGTPVFKAVGGTGGGIGGAGGVALGGTGGTATTSNGFTGYNAGAGNLDGMGGASPWGAGGRGRTGLVGATDPIGFGSGGRAGGSGGIPGGGGEWAVKSPVSVVPGTTYTVTIGAAGVAGTDATQAPSIGAPGYLLLEW